MISFNGKKVSSIVQPLLQAFRPKYQYLPHEEMEKVKKALQKA
jgi:hypothetical protein